MGIAAGLIIALLAGCRTVHGYGPTAIGDRADRDDRGATVLNFVRPLRNASSSVHEWLLASLLRIRLALRHDNDDR